MSPAGSGSITVQIVGIEKLQKALNGDMRRAIGKITLAAANQVKGFIAPYPAATAANMPDHRWYERGYGPRWRRKGGAYGGKKTSEQLNRGWAVEHHITDATVGNRASYAPVVHSAAEQAKFHGERDWVTDEQAVDKLTRSGALDLIAQQAINAVLGGK